MSGDGDRPDYLDRDKKSFSELDRLRRERRDGRDARPRDAAARARASAASKQYLAQIDGLFSGGRRGDEAALARAVLDARGSAGLADACRAYRDGVGVPTEARLLACFLDAGERDLVLEGLNALLSARAAGSLQASPGLRSQLRLLAQDADDEVAGAAEEILEAL